MNENKQTHETLPSPEEIRKAIISESGELVQILAGL